MLNNFAHIPQADLAPGRSRSVECGRMVYAWISQDTSFVILEVIPHIIRLIQVRFEKVFTLV